MADPAPHVDLNEILTRDDVRRPRPGPNLGERRVRVVGLLRGDDASLGVRVDGLPGDPGPRGSSPSSAARARATAAATERSSTPSRGRARIRMTGTGGFSTLAPWMRRRSTSARFTGIAAAPAHPRSCSTAAQPFPTTSAVWPTNSRTRLSPTGTRNAASRRPKGSRRSRSRRTWRMRCRSWTRSGSSVRGWSGTRAADTSRSTSSSRTGSACSASSRSTHWGHSPTCSHRWTAGEERVSPAARTRGSNALLPPARVGVQALIEVNRSPADHFDRQTLVTGLPAATLPVLFIHGELSVIPVRSTIETAALVPGAEVVIVPGSGHFPWVDRLGSVRAAVGSFLSSRQ